MCDSAWVSQIKIQYVKHTLRAYSLRSFLILRNWCPSVIFHISTESRLINFNFVFDTEMPYTTTSRPHINWEDPVVLITTSYSAKMWQMTTKWFDKKIKGDLPSSDPNDRRYFPSQCEHQSNNRLPQCKHEDKWVTSNGIGHTNEDFKKLLDYLHRHGWVITSYWTNEDQYLWWHYGITDTRPLWVKKKVHLNYMRSLTLWEWVWRDKKNFRGEHKILLLTHTTQDRGFSRVGIYKVQFLLEYFSITCVNMIKWTVFHAKHFKNTFPVTWIFKEKFCITRVHHDQLLMHLVLKAEYLEKIWSIPWLLMAWRLVSPGHQQP